MGDRKMKDSLGATARQVRTRAITISYLPTQRNRHGSCFERYVLDTLLKQSPENSPDGCASDSESSTKIRTLLVDDQLSALAVLQDILRYEPDVQIIGTASSGRDAIRAINQLAPDLVFLDVEMPEVDGFAVIAGIAAEKMPMIVFVTAREECALKGYEAEALDYVVKPWQPTRLHSAVERVRRRIHNH
jgi:CheY-like chemotaxis protein